MVLRPSLPPNHSKTTRILPVGRQRRSARLGEHGWHGADAAEEPESQAAGAEPQHVATGNAAVAQWILRRHEDSPPRSACAVSMHRPGRAREWL